MSFVKSVLLSIALVTSGAPAAFAAEETAILAGGCFWCIQKDFDHVKGVSNVVPGYTGGDSTSPNYQNHEGFVEAVKVTFDNEVVSYEQILSTFWRTVNPTDAGGQFCDRGHSYTTAVFTADDLQKKLAEKTKSEAAAELNQPVVTPILDAKPFYIAEDYHIDYYKKNPGKYKYYRWSCGRDQTVEKLWGKSAYQGVEGHNS